MSAGFGVILEESADEQLAIVGTACGGGGFNACSSAATELEFNYRLNGVDTFAESDYLTISIASTIQDSDGVQVQKTAIQNAFDTALGDASNLVVVKEQGAAILLVQFDTSIAEIDVRVKKDCKDAELPDDDDTLAQTDVFECAEGEKNIAVENAFKFVDEAKAKRAFQFGVSQVTIALDDLFAGAEATLAANVGGVIEIEAEFDASITGEIGATVGSEEMIPFVDWLIALVNMFDDTADGHIDGFLDAGCEFNATMNADVSALPPFDFVPTSSFSGEFAEPFSIDFLDTDTIQRPNITFEIDLPSIGNIRNLSFADVINIMQVGLSIKYLFCRAQLPIPLTHLPFLLL